MHTTSLLALINHKNLIINTNGIGQRSYYTLQCDSVLNNVFLSEQYYSMHSYYFHYDFE